LGNAIDPTSFPVDTCQTRQAIRSALGVPDEEFVVGHVGNFRAPKNHAGVVDIFAELIRLNPRARLLLVGQGPLQPVTEERCRTLGLSDRVRFLGLRDDVPALLSACDAFLFPSICEGLGTAVVEAQMAGLPCIVSEAVPDLADLGLGLFTRRSLAGPIEAWAKEILAAARQARPSWEERQRRLLLCGFDIRQAVSDWESLYLP
jgi:glycosyltransferase involved in cell wall biosynthesis